MLTSPHPEVAQGSQLPLAHQHTIDTLITPGTPKTSRVPGALCQDPGTKIKPASLQQALQGCGLAKEPRASRTSSCVHKEPRRAAGGLRQERLPGQAAGGSGCFLGVPAPACPDTRRAHFSRTLITLLHKNRSLPPCSLFPSPGKICARVSHPEDGSLHFLISGGLEPPLPPQGVPGQVGSELPAGFRVEAHRDSVGGHSQGVEIVLPWAAHHGGSSLEVREGSLNASVLGNLLAWVGVVCDPLRRLQVLLPFSTGSSDCLCFGAISKQTEAPDGTRVNSGSSSKPKLKPIQPVERPSWEARGHW